MLKGELGAVEVIVTLPLTVPAADGANLTVNDVFWPAFSVRGSVSPLMLNPLPPTEAAVMVTLEPPVFVRVSGKFALVPI